MIRLGSVVIRVTDLDAQKAFWMQALDLVDRPGDDRDFALLKPRSGTGPNVALDAHPSERALPPRIHLDLYADDQAAEIERLKALGATDVDWDLYPDDADFVVLADTEGNRFCVIDKSA